MSTALVQRLPRVDSTLGVMQRLAGVQVARGQARLLNISMGLPQPDRLGNGLVSIPEGRSGGVMPQQEQRPASIQEGSSSGVRYVQQQQQKQQPVSIPEAFLDVVRLQQAQRDQQQSGEEALARRVAASQRRERVVQRVLAQAQRDINAAKDV